MIQSEVENTIIIIITSHFINISAVSHLWLNYDSNPYLTLSVTWIFYLPVLGPEIATQERGASYLPFFYEQPLKIVDLQICKY